MFTETISIIPTTHASEDIILSRPIHVHLTGKFLIKVLKYIINEMLSGCMDFVAEPLELET